MRRPTWRVLLLACALTGVLTGARASTCGDCWCILANSTSPTCPPEPTDYSTDAELIAALAQQRPTLPPRLPCNPYEEPTCDTVPTLFPADATTDDTVCGLVYPRSDCARYHLRTFNSSAEAEAAGATVTHQGACGVCSTTQDLAAYMNTTDMTAAGTKCGVAAVLSPALGLACFERLGLSRPCALIWTQDALADTAACGAVCAKDLRAPYNGPPPACALNDCLQCDEDEAGPLFKRFAGRTRRRSGLESAIARPCDSVASLEHVACPV